MANILLWRRYKIREAMPLPPDSNPIPMHTHNNKMNIQHETGALLEMVQGFGGS